MSELHVPAAEEGVILGAAGIRIDPDRGTVDVEPVRVNQAIGDAYLVGLNELDPFCNCFEVRSIQRTPLSSGDIRLTLDLSFRHPFALAARPDLFGWDLKAIFASDRSATVFAGAGVVVDDRTVANRAGYTTEWSDQIAAAVPGLSTTAFPYIVLGEDPVPLEPFDFRNPGGWNVFPSGGTNTGELQLDLTPGTILSAHFFFTVGYQVSATRTTRQAPLYSPPRGNTRAAWRVNATVVSDTLTPSTGSTADVEVAIWDWQHGQGLGSDVASIRVYAPELMASPLTLTPSGGTGRGDSPLTATAVLINELGTVPAGSTLVLIEVVDELHENNPGGGGGNSGVTRIEDDLVTPSPLDDFRTFQAVRLQVGSGTPNNPPTAVLVTTPPMGPPGALTIPAGTTVNFDGSASSDPDAPLSPQGDLVLFEYDYEWDGVLVNFAPDESHPTPAPTSHLYGIQQSTKMGFGVTDGLGLRTIFT
ncbi:MAG TPA: hypothetical protein VEI97_06700, partial [bacterium]|nr:hypothetical protein [bacterium]